MEIHKEIMILQGDSAGKLPSLHFMNKVWRHVKLAELMKCRYLKQFNVAGVGRLRKEGLWKAEHRVKNVLK